MNLRWLQTAIETRDAQLDYIAEENPKAAIELGDRLDELIDQLRDYPELGRAGRVTGTRELVITRTPFIVVYRIADGGVEVLRILHGSQQWP